MNAIELKRETKFLRDELARRLEKNPSYSIRAFAKSLGIHVGSLSSILNGKRPLTAKTAKVLFQKLSLSPQDQNKVLKLLNRERKLQKSLEPLSLDRDELDQEIFRIISDWYHYGILQLIRTESYKQINPTNQVKWIARQLKISDTESALAVERLLDLNLIALDQNSRLIRTKNSVTTENKQVTSSALIKWQKQLRMKAIESLENDPIETRSMTSMTMSIDPQKFKEAKNLIDEFQERLAAFLEEGKRERVYQLCVSLFPLQVMEK